MATNIELALMAGRAYFDTRKDINRFSVPDGWSEKKHDAKESGFEAVTFQRGDEIVISFAGTYETDGDHRDLEADIALGLFGHYCDQLQQAAEYYLQVKAQVEALNPDATITLTGHSLGGGLAALIGVFFNEKAVTFDQAPFHLTAEYQSSNTAVYEFLLMKLQENGEVAQNLLKPLEEYVTSMREGNTNVLRERELDVMNIRVDGEFLSSDPPFTSLDTIGVTSPPLLHGGTDVSGINLHSISLLTAFLQNDQFRAVTTKLTDLLGMIFDSSLFYNETDTPIPNFLEHLVRHQEGLDPAVPNDGDHMLDHFTTDLWNIAQDGGLTMANSDLSKALTAFAMQAYYDNRLATNATLFAPVSGGIRFDRNDIADTLDAIKGYDLYFKNYLQTLPAEDRPFIEALLPNLLDWFIQAGSGGMTATAGNQTAFMLGGSGDDTLTGGSQADVLIGNGGADTLSGGGSYDYLFGGAGNDTLTGGTGSDTLFGGKGFDTYIWNTGDGNDTIIEEREADGKIHGIIKINNGPGIDFIAAGGFIREGTSNIWRMTAPDGSILTLTHNSSWDLVLADGSALELGDFQDGDFGMKLYENPEAERTLTGTDGDDQNAFSLRRSKRRCPRRGQRQ